MCFRPGSGLASGRSQQRSMNKNNNTIVVIALKGANLRFLQSPNYAVNCLQHVRSSDRAQLCTNYVQHIRRLSHATGCVQLRLTELKSHLFWLYFLG